MKFKALLASQFLVSMGDTALWATMVTVTVTVMVMVMVTMVTMVTMVMVMMVVMMMVVVVSLDRKNFSAASSHR
jgi:hypothetical protein